MQSLLLGQMRDSVKPCRRMRSTDRSVLRSSDAFFFHQEGNDMWIDLGYDEVVYVEHLGQTSHGDVIVD